MSKKHRLAGSILDGGFFELRRQLEYKVARAGGRVVVADRFFPSSKTCSACGSVQEKMPLSQRSWTCPDCGTKHDRDVNAAVNLKNLAASSAVTACGEESSGQTHMRKVKLASVKQEVSFS